MHLSSNDLNAELLESEKLTDSVSLDRTLGLNSILDFLVKSIQSFVGLSVRQRELMADESGDKKGRGRPKKADMGLDEDDKVVNRGRPAGRKAAAAASQAVRDQSRGQDDDGEPIAKRARGRPKGSTGKKRKKASKGKKRSKSCKAVTASGDTGADNFDAD